jgi:FtsP/CotA-like multicopper oxidase with cupredoxin domain
MKASVDPDRFLREFNYGNVSILPDGRTLREFTIIAQDVEIEVAPGIFLEAWTYNGTVPGPTIRVTEGDLVRINFINQGSHPHTIHLHGVHPAEMDGVFEIIGPGGRFVYEFTAEPFGLFLYHCHVQPAAEHINRGLYGVFIVDPKTPRPPADEMVMIMNGFDTDFDEENNFYAVNGPAFYYMKNPIEIKVNEPIRIYLVNILEFDPINSLHIHGNMYKLYRSGTSLTDYELTDMVTISQGERAVIEFSYKYPGDYMFHAHQNEFADKGWMGVFRVVDDFEVGGGAERRAAESGGH